MNETLTVFDSAVSAMHDMPCFTSQFHCRKTRNVSTETRIFATELLYRLSEESQSGVAHEILGPRKRYVRTAGSVSKMKRRCRAIRLSIDSERGQHVISGTTLPEISCAVIPIIARATIPSRCVVSVQSMSSEYLALAANIVHLLPSEESTLVSWTGWPSLVR